MKFWPFPLVRSYETNDGLSALFLTFARDPDLRVLKNDRYEMVISCSHGRLEFWNANRWYAWAHSGRFVNRLGRVDAWNVEMPSRYAVRAMRKAINHLGYSRVSDGRFALDAIEPERDGVWTNI